MSNIIPHEPAEMSVARPPSSTGLAALLQGGRAETAKALAAAVAACTSVRKEDRNEFHRYQYASADAIIAEGRKALAAAGLALLPVEASLNGWEREGENRFELVRTFVLLHTSGEVTPLRVCWPVVPDKGRPLDKATAAADTLSLSYLLRDILLMDRVDPADDVQAREDRSAPAKAKETPQKASPSGVPSQATICEAQVVELTQLMDAKGISWPTIVQKEGLPTGYTIQRLTCEQWGYICDRLKKTIARQPARA